MRRNRRREGPGRGCPRRKGTPSRHASAVTVRWRLGATGKLNSGRRGGQFVGQPDQAVSCSPRGAPRDHRALHAEALDCGEQHQQDDRGHSGRHSQAVRVAAEMPNLSPAHCVLNTSASSSERPMAAIPSPPSADRAPAAGRSRRRRGQSGPRRCRHHRSLPGAGRCRSSRYLIHHAKPYPLREPCYARSGRGYRPAASSASRWSPRR